MTAPAALSRAATTASAAATKSLNRGKPQVVGSPATSIESLMVIGTPSTGPVSPRDRAASASRAAVRARSKSGTQIALRSPSSR